MENDSKKVIGLGTPKISREDIKNMIICNDNMFIGHIPFRTGMMARESFVITRPKLDESYFTPVFFSKYNQVLPNFITGVDRHRTEIKVSKHRKARQLAFKHRVRKRRLKKT